jgi:hypothetical protein
VDRYNCSFNYYYRGKLAARVHIKNGRVQTEKFTDDFIACPFGAIPDERITPKLIDWFFTDKCSPEGREDTEALVRELGLPKFDAFEIVKYTGGKMAGSFYRIEFTSET